MNFLKHNAAPWALAVFISIPMAGSAQNGQKEQQPRFNVEVNLVSLDVEVLDKMKNPVLGLTAKEFVVKENGKTKEISNFAWLADRPVSLAIVLDTSALSNDKLILFKRFIIELARVMARSDEICLYSFDSRDAYLEQEFTSSRGLLQDALENIYVPSGGSNILKELMGKQPPTGLAIDLALNKLRATNKGRKALLVISNRFRGLGPATVEHLQESGCTLMTLGSDNKTALLVTLGGDRISKNQLMKQSGGRNFSAETEDIRGVCLQIAYSLKNYYALGYLTESLPNEKKPRRIDVQVPGKNCTINFRRGVRSSETNVRENGRILNSSLAGGHGLGRIHERHESAFVVFVSFVVTLCL